MTEFKHPEDGYVFIVTYGRSGSTLLQSLLNTIEGFQLRGENNNTLFHLYSAWAAVKDSVPLDGLRTKGEVTAPDHPWYGSEKIGLDSYGRDLARLFTQSVLQPDPGTRVSGFKEIRFHFHAAHFRPQLNFIHSFFPNSRFIFNTRSHADVVKSGWWAAQDPSKVTANLTMAEDLFKSYLATYPERGILMHYDDYTKDHSQLNDLFEFLGEPVDRKAIEKTLSKRLDHAR